MKYFISLLITFLIVISVNAQTPLPLPKGYQRLGPFSIDSTSVFTNLPTLVNYALSNGSAYAGQICAVAGTTQSIAYVINSDKSLTAIGTGTGGSGSTNASEIYVAFIPTNYVVVSNTVEEHLKSIHNLINTNRSQGMQLSGTSTGYDFTNEVTFIGSFTNIPKITCSWSSNQINEIAQIEIVEKGLMGFKWRIRSTYGLVSTNWTIDWHASDIIINGGVGGGTGGDNLGNHTATQILNMSGFSITNIATNSLIFSDGVILSSDKARDLATTNWVVRYITNSIIETNQILENNDTITSSFTYVNIQSTNGDMILNSANQIEDGQNNQVITLYGSSNSNTVTISSRNNVVLFHDVSFTLGLNDSIELIYRVNKWFEKRRIDFY